LLEIIRSYTPLSRARVALFDFDGTLSIIRSGWMPMMVSMFVNELQALNTGEDKERLTSLVQEIVLQLTGKETIHQMSALAEELRKRGGEPKSAAEYKHIFLKELSNIVKARLSALRHGKLNSDDLLVPGAKAALQLLRSEGVTTYLASGTDEESVKEEAELLDIAKYFGGNIFGARDDKNGFTKAALVEHLLSSAGYRPAELVGFGDGFVEIHEVSKAGGFAIGLATDEPECRTIEPGKRRHLIAAGAHIILPNFNDQPEWAGFLFAQPETVSPGLHEQ
jgi:phosphoglycolate phosphatase-like HAD superfamily hydrolase